MDSMRQPEHTKPRQRGSLLNVFMMMGLLLLAVAGLSLTYRVSGLAWRPLFFPSGGSEDVLLGYMVWQVRLPRLLLAVSLGAALAVAGCLLQAMTRNKLADPEIMGLNQGASFCAVIALLAIGGADSADVVVPAALLGAGICGLLVLLIASYSAKYSGSDPSRLVLAGVAISAFMGSLTTGTILLFETQLNEILYWMAGKLSGAEWRDNYLVWLLDIPAAGAAYLLAGRMNVLEQGDEVASGLGIHVQRTRILLGLLVIVLSGSAVAVAGPIGFVGLMVPHMARRIGGVNHKALLPLSAVMGALLLSLADFAAQWVSYPSDIPVGIITALLGVPFFLYLLRRKKGGRP
ncbi:FecCD family ABC transporter permease [Paenibacillus physcomitrellae]|uniref:Fe(3+)-citrate import system permease protein YfmD n=1 Tax=Paenibacillus physcomitrellae TaxID=1619311 RepID=A0ABQ1FUS8_9BACL|nr:iron ABC transporter permease [Paenibacillus physcomitrellae]GGA31423.1 Fe(3+)-citrate import system permease protein YfmD [Paenibacillus physcomitrellae]